MDYKVHHQQQQNEHLKKKFTFFLSSVSLSLSFLFIATRVHHIN